MKGKVIRDQCDCALCQAEGDESPWRAEVVSDDGTRRFSYWGSQAEAFRACLRELARIAKAGAA